MERLRAALIGCILTGGVLFGARPPAPDDQVVEPVVSSAAPGGRLGMTPEQLTRWFRPVEIGADLATLAPSFALVDTPVPPPGRERCNAARVGRRARY